MIASDLRRYVLHKPWALADEHVYRGPPRHRANRVRRARWPDGWPKLPRLGTVKLTSLEQAEAS